MAKCNAVYAAFDSIDAANTAATVLQELGFKAKDIKTFVPRAPHEPDYPNHSGNRILAGTLVGAIVGGFLGACLGFLAGMKILDIPLLTDAIVLGPIGWTTLGVVFAGLCGAGSGALVGIGVPYRATERYASYLDDGAVVLSVQIEDRSRYELAAVAVEQVGGTDVSQLDEESTQTSLLARGARKISSLPSLSRI